MSNVAQLRPVDLKLMSDQKTDVATSYSGGSGGGGDMESRVARLESDVSHIQRDTTEIKADLRVSMSDISEIKKDVALIAQKIDTHFDAQRKSSARIQWMVGVIIAAAALVPAYLGMYKSDPIPEQQSQYHIQETQPAPAPQAPKQ